MVMRLEEHKYIYIAPQKSIFPCWIFTALLMKKRAPIQKMVGLFHGAFLIIVIYYYEIIPNTNEVIQYADKGPAVAPAANFAGQKRR